MCVLIPFRVCNVKSVVLQSSNVEKDFSESFWRDHLSLFKTYMLDSNHKRIQSQSLSLILFTRVSLSRQLCRYISHNFMRFSQLVRTVMYVVVLTVHFVIVSSQRPVACLKHLSLSSHFSLFQIDPNNWLCLGECFTNTVTLFGYIFH